MIGMDNRAQSIGIAQFFLSLCVGAFVFWIVASITAPMFDYSYASTADPDALEATGWLETGVDYLPVIYLGIAFFGLIALSIFQREMLR